MTTTKETKHTHGVIHAFASMPIEVGCQRRKRPSYRWTQGYSEVTETGVSCPPMTRAALRSLARREGCRYMIHKSQTEAKQAISGAQP